MPVPRADYTCVACDETFELPVQFAGGCPACGGMLERKYSANVVTKPVVKPIERMLETAPQRIRPEAQTSAPRLDKSVIQQWTSLGAGQRGTFEAVKMTVPRVRPVGIADRETMRRRKEGR